MNTDQKASLLRFRLGSVAQTRAHLHVQERRTLLFFPAAANLAPAAPVLMELAFNETEQTRLLRGATLCAAPGGCWLEFPNPGLVSSETESGLLARRQHRRYGADLPVDVLLGGHAFRGRLHDASLVGARLVGESFPLKPGLRVALAVSPQADGASLPERLGPAVVVWSNRAAAGIYFDREDPACRASVGSLHAALQGAWKAARQAVHAPGCCQGGVLLEPALPPPP